MKRIYDAFRRKWVLATDEEIVRQQWLKLMVEKLHYPLELLVVEKELKILPHLKNCGYSLPKRRIDILSFSRGKNRSPPLLLIECKKGMLHHSAMDQACAYNTFVQAYCVAIVNRESIRLRIMDQEIDWLPSFHDLEALDLLHNSIYL